jgi:hypothetical protein
MLAFRPSFCDLTPALYSNSFIPELPQVELLVCAERNEFFLCNLVTVLTSKCYGGDHGDDDNDDDNI